MNRTRTLPVFAFALLGLGALSSPTDAVAAKPNILFIMSDEHNASVLGANGNAIIRTPNLDRLAASGVSFDACYCNSPLCVPSRASFLSGQYISRTGVWGNSCELPRADIPAVPNLLNAAGYESFLCGKMHLEADRRRLYRRWRELQHQSEGRTGRAPSGGQLAGARIFKSLHVFPYGRTLLCHAARSQSDSGRGGVS